MPGNDLFHSPPFKSQQSSQDIQDMPVQLKPLLLPALMQGEWPMELSAAFDTPDVLLAYGDVYLEGRESATDDVAPLKLYTGDDLYIPDQWYLVLLNQRDARAAWDRLDHCGAADLEAELHYDDNSFKDGSAGHMVLVEKQAGAAWAVWHRLLAMEV